MPPPPQTGLDPAAIGFLPNGQLADKEMSAYKKRNERFLLYCGDGSGRGDGATSRVKSMMERHQVLQNMLIGHLLRLVW